MHEAPATPSESPSASEEAADGKGIVTDPSRDYDSTCDGRCPQKNRKSSGRKKGLGKGHRM